MFSGSADRARKWPGPMRLTAPWWRYATKLCLRTTSQKPAPTSVRNEHRASRKHVTGVIRSVAQRQRDPTRSPRAGTRHIRSVFGSCNVPRSHNFNGCTFRFHESFGFYEQVYLTSIDADDLRELAPREESFCRRCVKKSANVIASRVPPQNAPGLIA